MHLTGRKIPGDIDNPIDHALITVVEKLNPIARKWGATPNHITTVSAAFGAITLYAMHQSWYVVAAVAHLLQYFFDCMDGNYARMYNMVTVFGDYYDHLKDLIVAVGVVIIIMCKRIPTSAKVFFIIALAFFVWNISLYVTCQEALYGKNESSTLELISIKNPYNKDYKMCLQNHRHFAFGSANVFIAVFIACLTYLERAHRS